MISIFKPYIFLTASVVLLSLPATAQAETNDLADLVGARASSGELALQSRGYEFIKSQKGDDRVWSYWYQPSTNNCVTVAIYNGRYDAITDSPTDCGEPSNYRNNIRNINNHIVTARSTPDDVINLINARAAGAENVLIRNGYQDIQGYTGSKTKGILWWNPIRQDCLGVVTSNGRIKTINHLDKKSCD